MTESPATLPSAGVLRRLGAMFYDLLLVVALMMVVTAVLLPFTGGDAITSERFGAWEYGYQVLLLVLFIVFFGVFWTRRGQTLGMVAWRLRIERNDGRLLRWSDVLKRLAPVIVALLAMGLNNFVIASIAMAAICLGYAWIWLDRDRLAWQDRLTRTRVVVLPKKR